MLQHFRCYDGVGGEMEICMSWAGEMTPRSTGLAAPQESETGSQCPRCPLCAPSLSSGMQSGGLYQLHGLCQLKNKGAGKSSEVGQVATEKSQTPKMGADRFNS